MSTSWLAVALAAQVVAGGAAGCARRREPSETTFTAGVNQYLERRGDLCLGKPRWPIDVTAADRAAGDRDAIQLPTLERLGVVRSSPSPEAIDGRDPGDPQHARRYQLTDVGRRSFIDRGTRKPVDPDAPPATGADFCPVRLRLQRVVTWELQSPPADPPHATVSYTYAVEAPDWARTPAARRVFPAMARVIDGAGGARLEEGFSLTAGGWVADDLLPAAVAAPAGASGALQARGGRP